MIEHKLKTCKAIGKAKGFEGCGRPSAKRHFGLCASCYFDFLTTDERGKVIYAKSFSPKVKKKTEAVKKQRFSEMKQNTKRLSDYEADAKKSFQKFIRIRDKDLPCISCGTTSNVEYAGGHYFAAGMYSGLMFDERNCHKQCNVNCNKYKSGNLIEYRMGLIHRYGEDFVNEIESDAPSKRQRKYTKDELLEIKKNYDQKIKQLGF